MLINEQVSRLDQLQSPLVVPALGVENRKRIVLNVDSDIGAPGARTDTLRTGSKAMLLAAESSLWKDIAVCFRTGEGNKKWLERNC